jgi:membrane-associated protein
MFLILTLAAILGDSLNYAIGHYIGPKVFKKNYKWLNKRHLDKTHEFFEKYGGKTIVLARFIPIIRTFAPFVAGIGSMEYKRFLTYNILGGILWVGLFFYAGFFFGNIPIIKNNFSIVIIIIILTSLIPIVIEVIKYYREKNKDKKKKE